MMALLPLLEGLDITSDYAAGTLSKRWSFGRGGGDRTRDLLLKRQLLYH
jgi:hypothetical protein